ITNKLNKFICLHKDRLPLEYWTNVVYRINCINCDASYVGQTRRKLSTRIKEHKKGIYKNDDFDWANISVLDEEPCYKRRLISEMIHIASQDFSLNIQSDTINLDKSYV
ncbi:hypothetical protein EAG_15774, partial [Camponotus floridanus]